MALIIHIMDKDKNVTLSGNVSTVGPIQLLRTQIMMLNIQMKIRHRNDALFKDSFPGNRNKGKGKSAGLA